MAWYYTAAIIAAFIGLMVAFYLLGRKGVLDGGTMKVLRTILAGVASLVDSIKEVMQDNTVVDTFAVIVDLLEKAVYAAENLYYNKEISADERKAKCLEIFDELLAANGIVLTESVEAMLDNLIAAICEEMGHGQGQKGDAAK